jgi:GrpB-like predicted nucleotidyltransferase (UPF0157 family)
MESTSRLHTAVLPQEIPMHSVAVPTDPKPSDAGMTGASTPPISRYLPMPVQVHQADPDAPEVARRLIALIATRWPGTPAEHIGSSAVPGLAGKNIIDLLLAAKPADTPAITQALLELGFQPQVPAAFPATRPMLWGAFRHRATTYPVHVHVVPAGSPEVAALRGFRDALRADPVLRRRYAALKRAIVAGGPVDPVTFTKAKHDWIAAALTRLGLASHQPRRLYQEHLGLDRPTDWPHDPPTLLARVPIYVPIYGAANKGGLLGVCVVGTQDSITPFACPCNITGAVKWGDGISASVGHTPGLPAPSARTGGRSHSRRSPRHQAGGDRRPQHRTPDG